MSQVRWYKASDEAGGCKGEVGDWVVGGVSLAVKVC